MNINFIETNNMNEEEYTRYKRQLILPEIGEKGQEKLKFSKVLVIGAGGLGSPAIYYLAAAGIGTIGIVDSDEVDVSNLQRQIIHRNRDLGKLKVDSAYEKALSLNPNINVITYPFKLEKNNIADIISEYDFVIDCVDNFKTKFLINDECVRLKKPFCYGGVAGFEGHIMTYVPDKGPCLRCVFDGVDEKQEDEDGPIGVIGALPGIIGSYQALEAMKYLIGIGENLVGRFLIFNGLTFTHKILPVEKASWCKICGER